MNVVVRLPPLLLSHLRIVLGREHTIITVDRWDELTAEVRRKPVDLVVADPRAEGTVRLDELRTVIRDFPSLPVVIYTILAPETLGVPVPNLILQPLVENALRYGIAPREAGGRLEINARCRDGLLQLEVRDDGPKLAGDLSSLAQGVGLSNTRARLDQLYGSSHRFELCPAEAGGFVVRIGLPL